MKFCKIKDSPKRKIATLNGKVFLCGPFDCSQDVLGLPLGLAQGTFVTVSSSNALIGPANFLVLRVGREKAAVVVMVPGSLLL
jgi:hypothetical protein